MRYLAAREFIALEQLVDAPWRLDRSTFRNSTVRVSTTDRPGLVVKMAASRANATTLANEAAIYHQAQEQRARFGILLPAVHSYDPEQAVLILELVPGARTLREEHAQAGTFSADLARASGVALARVHGAQHIRPIQPDHPPQILSFHRLRLGRYRQLSAGSRRLVALLQSEPAFGARLDQLAASWRPTCLVHNDFKWENMLVCRDHGTAPDMPIRIIDWELAAMGDPAWDVGSGISNYLHAWIASMPIHPAAQPEDLIRHARAPLRTIQLATSQFWSAYIAEAGLNATEAGTWIPRVTAFAGARLLYLAYERSQTLSELDGMIVILAQTAMNLLLQPELAARQLIGIHPSA
jgi:aminoglycoside phosphotransferase (APT) family kinase protein